MISPLQRGARAVARTLRREAEDGAGIDGVHNSRKRTTHMTDTANESQVFGLSSEDRRAVETFYRAFNGRPELLDQAVTPDWQDIPLGPGQRPGRDGMKPLIEAFAAAFPDAEIKIHEIIAGPDRAAVRLEITGTHTGEWFGVAPTGRSFVLPLHEFHRIENGKLTHTWHLEDWFGWLNQVGAWPPQTTTKRGDTMKAARLSGYNAAPTLEEIPVPEIGSDDVLVRVGAASMNPMDNKLQMGVLHDAFPLEFPYTMGTDLAGTVERVGPDVVGWSQGDRVLARTDPTSGGALAELAVLPASYLVRVPESMSIERAAAIPTTAATAYQALFEMADLKPGQTVLVHAGTGGVGSIAIQFAKAAGARVIATASGDGVEITRRLGADEVIDYRQEDFTEKVSGVDLVLDTVGGETQRRSFGVLRPGGLLLGIAVPPDEEAAGAYDVKTAFNVHISDAARLEKVVERVDAAGTEVLIDRTVPLDSLDEAFARQGSGRARGKILLTP